MKKFLQKSVVAGLIVLFSFVTFGSPIVQGFSFPDRYDLVALLVEEGMYRDAANYDGLTTQIRSPRIRSTTLKSRIDRYAIDIQKTLPGSRVVIIQVDRYEKPENIRTVLQRLYFDGDPKEPARTAFLKGVVAIGEVPLPVVTKGGNRFISLFPYTDLEDAAYIFNAKTGDFELNPEVIEPRVELWHGVIKPPVSTQTPEGRAMLAQYFDKNYLYHAGDPAFAQFDKRLLFQDFFHEQDTIDETAYKSYLSFLEHQDDVVYSRYTKKLFQELSASIDDELGTIGEDARDLRAELEAAGVPFDDTVPQPAIDVPDSDQSGPNKNNIPDILTKMAKMSDNLMKRFNEIFSTYPNLINDFVRYTGRYYVPNTATVDDTDYLSNADSSVNLIAAKDQAVMNYLRYVNDMIERAVDAAALQIERPVSIGEVNFSIRNVRTRSGGIIQPDEIRPYTPPNDEVLNTLLVGLKEMIVRGGLAGGMNELMQRMREAGLFLPGMEGTDPDHEAPTINFINYSPQVVINDLGYFPEFFRTYPLADSAYNGSTLSLPAHINGYTLDEITSVEQCSLLRGSIGNGSYSKLVEANRALDVHTAKGTDENHWFPGLTELEKEKNTQCYGAAAGGSCESFEHFGGCFYDGTNLYAQPDAASTFQQCYADHATDPVFDIAGTRQVTEIPFTGYDDYRACLYFRPKETLYAHRLAVDQVLEALDNNDQGRERAQIVATARRMIDQGLDIPNADPHPNDQIIFTSRSVPRFTLTLGDVLRGRALDERGNVLSVLEWDEQNDPRGWRNVLAQFLAGAQERITIQVNHPIVSDITILLSRREEKNISSIRVHKEPTKMTLVEQGRSMVTQELPVDEPRYITFQNNDKQPVSLGYPDVFSIKNLDEFLARLRTLESQLNEQPQRNGQAQNICNNCLTSLISPLAEQSVVVEGETAVNRANQFKLADAISWKDMNIDSKHVYVSEVYLDSQQTAYVAPSAERGYEIAYFNGEGDAYGYDLSFNKQLSQIKNEPLPELDTPYRDDPNNPFDMPPEAQGTTGYDLFSWAPPPISPWWERVKEWKNKLDDQTNLEISFGAEKDALDAAIKRDNEDSLLHIKEESAALIASPEKADEIELSRVAKIVLSADALSAVAGKKVNFTVALRDNKNNPVADEFNRVTLVINDSQKQFITIVNNDEDPTIDGHQISVIGERAQISFIAPENPGLLGVSVSLAEREDIKVNQTFSVLASAQLNLAVGVLATVADGRGEIPVTITAIDAQNNVLSDVNGIVRIGLSDQTLAQAPHEVLLRNGRARFTLQGGVKKGELILNANFSNLDPGAATIKFLPGRAVTLVLTKTAEVLIANPGEFVDITAQIFDEFNNLIDTNNGTQVAFRLNEGAQEIAQLAAGQTITRAGQATVRLQPQGKTGTVTITAESDGLRPARIVIDSVKKFGSGSLATSTPETLVAALLGIPAGNIAVNNAFGPQLVFSGKVEAVTTLTTSPKQYGKIFEVTERGSLRTDTERVSVHFIPANHLTFLLRDTRYGVDLAKIGIVPKKENRFELTEETDSEKLEDGIYMRKIAVESTYDVDKKKGSLRVIKDNEERIEVQTNGYIKVLDQNFSVRPKDGAFLTLEIIEGASVIAEVYIVQRFNQNVRLFNGTGEISNDAPGVYVQQFALPDSFFFAPTFSSNTTAASTGMALYDRLNIVTGPGAPGFSYNSFEDSFDAMGVGFTKDNKFALLFSGGEHFGEANRHYMSDATILLGDPTVKLGDPPRDASFTTDVGSLLYAGMSDVRGLLPFDVNSDGFEDLLIVEDEGLIRYLQNNGGVDAFIDRGLLLNIKNGIQDFTKVDINNDDQMDLVIAGRDGCTVDSTCIDILLNNRGVFTRKNISFDQTEKITTLQAADMNLDRLVDFVMVDTAGDISILYNSRNGFVRNRDTIGNVGLKTDPQRNLISGVLLRYAGMPERDLLNPEALQQYQFIELEEVNPLAAREVGQVFENSAGNRNAAGTNVAVQAVQKDFVYADAPFSPLKLSTKFAQDLNGGVLRNGDRVRYTITLINTTQNSILRTAVSDTIADQLSLDTATIRCVECGQNEMQITQLKGDIQRPFLLRNITIPAGGRRTITYEANFNQVSNEAEKVTLVVKNNFIDINERLNARLNADRLPDISINKEGNTSGQVQYFISNTLSADRKVSYVQNTSSSLDSGQDVAPSLIGAITQGLGAVSSGNEDAVPDEINKKLQEFQTKDSDGDGLQDSLDNLNGTLENVANNVQDAVDKLTCNAGCIALPLNRAFLAPGFFSVMGIPGSFDIGLPAFGWGVPSLIPTWPPSGPPQAARGGRFYISPTLTGGIGFSLCLGPYATAKNCYSFGINPLDLLPGNICDKINGGTQKLLAKANSAVNDLDGGVTAAIKPIGGKADERGGSGLVNYSLGSYEAPVNRKRNVRVPGFPAVITDWWAAQLEEIIDKATDLPDLYVIYPKLDSIAQSVLPSEAFTRTSEPLTNILSWINSIPLFDIQSQEVTFKVPILTEKQIAKLKADALQWVKDERLELDRWKQMLKCFVPMNDPANPNNNAQFLNLELCRFVDVEMNKLITTVIENVRRLDDWVLFPKKVLQFRTIKSYYINQVVNYLDTIIQFMGGWVKRNTAIVKRWRKSIREMTSIIENYKFLVQLMVDANASCDRCTTERYGLDELILKLFIGLPKPPVIPLPKLPDIIVDVSKIQAGVTIQWPDIRFQPEPFIIPKLPRIRLGINLDLPLFKLMLPEIPVIPAPPELPNLPALPPLQLGSLPDLPPAPTLPDLPNGLQATLRLLSQLLRIYCIVKLGFTPTDEVLLKTRIEQITARGLTPILPVDLLYSFTGPSISITYIDQIIVTAFLNLRTDMSFIQRAVESVAEKSNAFTNAFVKKINKYTENLSKNVESYTSPTININKEGASFNGKKINYNPVLPVPSREEDFIDALRTVFGSSVSSIDDAREELAGIFTQLRNEQESYAQHVQNVPSQYTLTIEPIAFNDAKKHIAHNLGSHEIEAYAADEDFPLLKDLFAYRDALQTYADSDNKPSQSLSQLIAHTSGTLPKSPFKRYLASTQTPIVIDEPVKVSSILPNAKRIAQAPNIPSMNVPIQDSLTASGVINNVGIFYEEPITQARRLINYTLEAEQENHLAVLDADNDGDNEKIYSYGRNVFIKNNYRIHREESVRALFRAEDLEYWTIFELLKGASSPRDVRVVSETAHHSTITFATPEVLREKIIGFDVVTHSSVEDFLLENNRSSTYTARYILARDGENVPTIATRVTGTTTIEGAHREYITHRTGVYHLQAGDMLHALGNAQVRIELNTKNERTSLLTPITTFSVPNTQAGGLDVEVIDGRVEVIHVSRAAVTQIESGSLLLPGEKITPKTGVVILASRNAQQSPEETFNDGDARLAIVRAGQSFSVHTIESLESISISLGLSPGFHFGRLHSIMSDGSSSVSSQIFLLAPQICGDLTVPYANAGTSEMSVAVGKEVTIDTSRSFDSNGTLVEYWLDTDNERDSNNDGDTANDKDIVHNATQKIFTVGPFENKGDRSITLTVLDEARNRATQRITIHVVEPRIILESEPLKNNTITGHVEPREVNVPVSIARLRANGNAGWELIKSPSANENGQYLTDTSGIFTINDMYLEDGFILYAGDLAIAHINNKTGRITIIDPHYEVRVLSAQIQKVPTRVAVFKKGDIENASSYTYVYYIPDVNTDVSLDKETTAYTAQNISGMSGVHIKPLAALRTEKFTIKNLSGADQINPGAVIIRDDTNQQSALIDVNGDVILNNISLHLRIKAVQNPRNSNDPVVFELLHNTTVIAEIFVPTQSLGHRDAQIITNPELPPRPRVSQRTQSGRLENSPTDSINRKNSPQEQPFSDIKKDDPFNAIIKKLYERGIVSGYQTAKPGVVEYKPAQEIARSEFTQITLKMLCIVPREEARRLPTPFYDVVDPTLWFYSVLKEGNIRGFIKGYLGEGRRDAITGQLLTPFRAARSINRAEAVTVVIAALNEQGIIDLNRADMRPRAGDQWYDPYMRVALNITPYLVDIADVPTRAFLITRDEALRPTEPITRGDFALMAERVLLVRDCYSSDGEISAGAEDFSLVPNSDSVPGTDQTGSDFSLNSNNDEGVNAVDRTVGRDARSARTEGIFIVDQGCANVCPCRTHIEPAAVFSAGDIIFAAITGPNGIPIYAKSNEEELSGL